MSAVELDVEIQMRFHKAKDFPELGPMGVGQDDKPQVDSDGIQGVVDVVDRMCRASRGGVGQSGTPFAQVKGQIGRYEAVQIIGEPEEGPDENGHGDDVGSLPLLLPIIFISQDE